MNQHLELVALRLFSQRWLSDCFLHGRCEFANALSCGRSSLTDHVCFVLQDSRRTVGWADIIRKTAVS